MTILYLGRNAEITLRWNHWWFMGFEFEKEPKSLDMVQSIRRDLWIHILPVLALHIQWFGRE